MIKLHPEGNRIVSISLIITIIFLSLAASLLNLIVFIPLLLLTVVTLFLIFRFFRIPKRDLHVDDRVVLAPADGKVVAIEEVTENEYFHDKRIQVSIFMSIHNVHINWFPVSGHVKYYKYHPGKYLVARHPKSSEMNERSTVVIETKKAEILVRQIAGYVARRIICYAVAESFIEQSDEMGFIRFGSRLDVLLPEDSNILVKMGDKITGAVTPLAEI